MWIRYFQEFVSRSKLVEIKVERAQILKLVDTAKGLQIVVIQRQLFYLVVGRTHAVDLANVAKVQFYHFGLQCFASLAIRI